MSNAAIDKEPVSWAATVAYRAGMKVLEDGVVYVSNWWTRNCRPSTNNGDRRRPWTVFARSVVAPPAIAVGLAAAALLANTSVPLDRVMSKPTSVFATPAGDNLNTVSARVRDSVAVESSDNFLGPDATLADIDPGSANSLLAMSPWPSFHVVERAADADEAWSATFAQLSAPTLADFAATNTTLGRLLQSVT
jgi:hypothetical protein